MTAAGGKTRRYAGPRPRDVYCRSMAAGAAAAGERPSVMQHEPLDYATPEPRGERPSLVVIAAVAPFVMLAIYFVGTIVLQKFLDNGGRGTWQRAAGWIALPTGLVTFAALVVGVAGWVRPVRSRPAAILATLASIVMLAAIVLSALPWE